MNISIIKRDNGTYECLDDENNFIYIGLSIENCINEIENFILPNKKINFEVI